MTIIGEYRGLVVYTSLGQWWAAIGNKVARATTEYALHQLIDSELSHD